MNSNLIESTAWQKKISSGQNFDRASDNIYAVSRGVELDFDIARLNIYKTNQTVVSNLHNSAQTQMEGISSQLDSMKQILIQARNAIIPAELTTLKVQVEGMRLTIQNQMVAQDAVGRPLFASVVNDAQIEPNVYVASGVSFEEAFKNTIPTTISGEITDLAGFADGDTFTVTTANGTYSTAFGRSTTVGDVHDWIAANESLVTTNPIVYTEAGSLTVTEGAFSVTNASTATNTDPASTRLIQSIIDLESYLTDRVAGKTDAELNPELVTLNLQNSYDQLNYAQQVSGGVARQIDRSKTSLDQLGTSMSITSSELLDTNFAAASAAFTRSQTLLSAAQAMFARLQQSNLFSKL
jgi:flagellin-like hook-associated protein FlgL